METLQQAVIFRPYGSNVLMGLTGVSQNILWLSMSREEASDLRDRLSEAIDVTDHPAVDPTVREIVDGAIG